MTQRQAIIVLFILMAINFAADALEANGWFW